MIDQTAQEIREMRTHSSSAVAIGAARALLDLCEREYQTPEEVEQSLERNSSVLRLSNPSHASLHTTQRAIVSAVSETDHESVEEVLDALRSAIERTIERVQRAKDEAAEVALELIEDGDVLLTHDFSTTVETVAQRATARGDHLEVRVTEARPRFMGRRMARTLAEIDAIDVTLIVDSAAGHYLDECDRVIVGMDCIVGEYLYNRVGTFPIAACANHLDIPMTVVGGASKVVDGGFVFENDYRSAVEVMREPASSFEVANPAYDATPVSLIDAIVTDEGITRP